MNIFVIPSWFPSKDRPVSGAMIKEQLEAFCHYYPSANVGVSIWGQMEEQFLLWSKDHIKNITKLVTGKTAHYTTNILPNLRTYHTPTYTWTNKVLKGNLRGIIRANIQNLTSFEADYGSVDVIHVHTGYPAGMIAMEVAKAVNKPYCLTEHMGPFPRPQTTDRSGMLSAYYKQPYQRSSINIAVSPFQADVMQSQGIRNLAVIPNFVDEQYFKPLSSYQFSTNRPFIFFTLAYISSNKGIDVLLKAIHEVSQEYKNVVFNIGGSSPFLQRYKQMASDLGIDDYVEWLGEIDRDKALLEYQNCDAFVLPSLYESMGVVYIEALACGKPIIATKCGGPETTVTPFNGLLIEKNNVEDLTMAIHKLIETRANYSSSEIRDDFMKRFSAQAVVPKLFDIYKNLAGANMSTQIN